MQIRIYEDYLFYILPPCHTFGTPLAENGSLTSIHKLCCRDWLVISRLIVGSLPIFYEGQFDGDGPGMGDSRQQMIMR